MPPAARPWLSTAAAVIYSAALGFLVAGMFWHTFKRWLPPDVVVAIGALLGIRVATLFASMTAAAVLDWKAIWIGGGSGVAALLAWWPATGRANAAPPPALLVPVLLSTLVVTALAGVPPARQTAHFYRSSRFARLLHFLQGLILFFMALPASLFWTWTRPYVIAVVISAFGLWKSWGGCPVTLAENEARAREGLPIMPPDSGFISDVFARCGVTVSGETVGRFLYGIGLSLCGWFGVRWFF